MVAVLLTLLLVIVGWQPFMFPSDFKNTADSFFSATLAKKDDSFSHILSRNDKGFARALKPQKFSFPPEHGPYNYRYWEGAVSVNGTKNGKPISGQGYVELAGYQ